jgi:hypothetical protein
MVRLVLIGGLVGAAACGSDTDDRPATLDYITQTIFAPSCASAECHSAFRAQVGDVFDTPRAARRSIVENSLVVYPDDVANPEASTLIQVLTIGTPSLLSRGETVRMPYDAPMPDADVDLIRRWIGEGAVGAQCLPNAERRSCQVRLEGSVLRYAVVACDDGNVGDVIMPCEGDDVCSLFKENGRCVAP